MLESPTGPSPVGVSLPSLAPTTKASPSVATLLQLASEMRAVANAFIVVLCIGLQTGGDGGCNRCNKTSPEPREGDFLFPPHCWKIALARGRNVRASFSSTKWHDPIQRSKTCRQSQCWRVQLFNVRPWGPESEYDDIGVAGNLIVTSFALGSLDVLVCSLLHQHVSHHNKLLWSFASHLLFGNSNAGGT